MLKLCEETKAVVWGYLYSLCFGFVLCVMVMFFIPYIGIRTTTLVVALFYVIVCVRELQLILKADPYRQYERVFREAFRQVIMKEPTNESELTSQLKEMNEVVIQAGYKKSLTRKLIKGYTEDCIAILRELGVDEM